MGRDHHHDVAARFHTLSTLCFMAPDASPGLLGAVTLEEFGLRVDLMAQRLIPVKTYLTECRALHRAAP